MANLVAPAVRKQGVSVTRKMAASLPSLRAIAQSKGLKVHHLGAGYPHPEVTDPRGFLKHQEGYFSFLREREGLNDPETLPEFLRESYSYTDTLGPLSSRQTFAEVYGRDWGIKIDPEKLIPTVGASGGISLACSLFERSGESIAYITDAPTYAGFTARASLCQHATIYSVEMDSEGAIPDLMRSQIRKARSDGHFVPFYYTVPDGHNPAGFSFSQRRREEIIEVLRDEQVLVLEDAPYLYINYAEPENRAVTFLGIAPEQTIHLFTGSKIGFPGPRVGYLYSDAVLEIEAGETVDLSTLALTESSSICSSKIQLRCVVLKHCCMRKAREEAILFVRVCGNLPKQNLPSIATIVLSFCKRWKIDWVAIRSISIGLPRTGGFSLYSPS